MSKIDRLETMASNATVVEDKSILIGNTLPKANIYRAIGKRSFDLLFICAISPLVLPVIAGLAVVAACDGSNPFFGHKRVGRGGREFRCWKIRSMVPDAEKKLRVYLEKNPRAKAEWDANFKLNDDPRITRIGNFLRRSSLDELPQLWNILKGEMSVVGPRPVTKKELELYGPSVREYHALRPGLTGPWQVGGRNDLSYNERVTLDVKYARRHNFWGDVKIILGTVKAVLAKTGR